MEQLDFTSVLTTAQTHTITQLVIAGGVVIAIAVAVMIIRRIRGAISQILGQRYAISEILFENLSRGFITPAIFFNSESFGRTSTPC